MKSTYKNWLLLYLAFLVYSGSTILSKLAAGQSLLSFAFCGFYGGTVILLAVYAALWQQVLKRMPLSTAYANKAVVIVLGMVWGKLLFGEDITLAKLAGGIIIIAGVCLVVKKDE